MSFFIRNLFCVTLHCGNLQGQVGLVEQIEFRVTGVKCNLGSFFSHEALCDAMRTFDIGYNSINICTRSRLGQGIKEAAFCRHSLNEGNDALATLQNEFVDRKMNTYRFFMTSSST